MGRPVGIDLGTTRSVVACVDENGRPRILSDASGVSLVPSVVLFEEDGVLVGDIARDSAVAMPTRVVECVKRHIGEASWRFAVGPRSYTAEEVSAFILQEMKRIAEEALEGPVTQAVITVPAYFHDGERTGTIRAAQRAGLEVLKILNEPTAAAMSYGIEEEQDTGRFLVYDLGGGTFDITVMRRVSANRLETVCTRGNHRLGGKDWDDRLLDHVAELFRERHGVDPRDDIAAQYDLRLRCEQAKIALSERIRTQIVCQFTGKSLSVEITREAFESLTADLLRLTETEVDLALQEAGLAPADMGLALLAGGSSKMPMVQSMMSRKAPKIRMSKNPDHCVALGAAIEAARLSVGTDLYKPEARRFLTSTEVKDRTPHGLGVLAMEENELINATIIPKNTEIPCERSREDFTTAYPDQTTLSVHLVQGEDREAMACVPVATYEFSGIPPRKKGESVIRISYRYNENNVVEVSAFDVKSGRQLERKTMPLVDLLSLREQMESEAVAARGSRKRRVALLVDASGSMSGNDMVRAREACHRFINDTDFGWVEVGLVQFGMDSKASIVHAVSTKPAPLHKAVDTLQASGGTPMDGAIRLGTEMVTKSSGAAELFLVLFTDGLPNERTATIRAAEEAKARGVKIICIGIGAADKALLNQLATAPGEVDIRKSSDELVATFGNLARVISSRFV
jgi:molecular chaperone DnaK